jgi:ADP-ribose pyrophosphatase YjhB (NUDIX family)
MRQPERRHYFRPVGPSAMYRRRTIFPRLPVLYWQADGVGARIKRVIIPYEVFVTVLQDLRARYEPQLRRVFHLYFQLARGMTLGVRAVVLDGESQVFLVKHSYVSGWYLPGGGVEIGETLLEALRRELAEEGRIEVVGEPVLHGVFLNDHVSRRDHVAVYVVRNYRQDRPPEPNREIVATGFFDSAALPADTTPGTRLRIAEVLGGRAPISRWR